MKISKTEKAESLATLSKHFRKGVTVYTILRHVSASGMMRVFDVYVIEKNEPVRLSWSAAQVLGWTYNSKREGVTLSGCGMDMGFHLVYSLSSVVLGDGYALTHRHL